MVSDCTIKVTLFLCVCVGGDIMKYVIYFYHNLGVFFWFMECRPPTYPKHEESLKGAIFIHLVDDVQLYEIKQ